MKLKLDLHPIFNDTHQIEAALQGIIEEAVAKRATEIEIIPGKGSGALKKSVLRFLDRPDIKARYHRLEKDGDNWGRLFVHFRHERNENTFKSQSAAPLPTVTTTCACCREQISTTEPDDEVLASALVECPFCGSPNRFTFRRDRRGFVHATAVLDYGA